MPFREYKCDECNRQIEVRESIDAPKFRECDGKGDCNNKGKLKRIVSRVSDPKFNGTGFYETDY